MRFNTVITAGDNLQKKYRYLRYLLLCPDKIFSFDLIYYIMKGYELDWVPTIFTDSCWIGEIEIIKPGPRVYTPHPMSMFSETVRFAVKNILRNDNSDFEKIFEELVPLGAENKLEIFTNYVRKVTGKLLSRDYVDFVEVLAKFTYIGRLTATFYKHGTKDCAEIAPYLIASTFTTLTTGYTYAQCHRDLIEAGVELSKWFRENGGEVIDKEFYDENADDDHKNSETYDEEEMLNEDEEYIDAKDKF